MVGDLANLPFEKNRFQVLLDRGCLTQNSHEKIREYLSEFLRVVVPGGSVLCFTLFGDRHPDMEFGVQVGEGCWDHFKEGYFKNVGLTSFFNYDILRELFKNFQTVDISKEIVYGSKNQILSEEYSVIAKT
jgi:ubiquinone/menaquinone biosynthesis C-methylase UbiE